MSTANESRLRRLEARHTGKRGGGYVCLMASEANQDAKIAAMIAAGQAFEGDMFITLPERDPESEVGKQFRPYRVHAGTTTYFDRPPQADAPGGTLPRVNKVSLRTTYEPRA